MRNPSLPEAYQSVDVPKGASLGRRFLAIAGPGFMVSVGYMDPGNWATDIAGGSRYGYQLLWVILASNLMAILLQTLCLRLGLVTGRDLAQACRDYYKKPAAIALWLLCELAIVACDLAEVIGSAIALNLLFGLPLVAGVLITGLDVLLLLLLVNVGFRKLEAVVLVLVATVATCFGIEVLMSNPAWGEVAHGLLTPRLPDSEALFISLGILGATVMPHNLYLHSSIVQTRKHHDLNQAIKLNTVDTVLALMWAFFVNASILVISAAVFHKAGHNPEELQQAYTLLTPLLGGTAATLFAVALLCSGQSSTITGTLAGQIVMEGFLNLRIKPWLRRLITRGLAIIPAVALIVSTNGKGTVDLLVVSQVVLSLQLSFAIFPLVMFTSCKEKMGEYANGPVLKVLAYGVCLLIAGLNIAYLVQSLGAFWMLTVAAISLAFSAWVRWGYKGS